MHVEFLVTFSFLGARVLEVPSLTPLSLHGRQRPRIIMAMLLELAAMVYWQRNLVEQ